MPALSVANVERIKASQYVDAVALVVLLWDHVLTFPDEVQLIWRARLSIPKVLFLFNRYVVPVAMIVHAYQFSGTTPYLSLMVWSAIGVAVGMLSITTSNFLVLLRLWVLWDRSPRLIMNTLAFFLVTQLAAIGLAAYVIYEMMPTLIFDSFLRICTATAKPKFALLWSPGMAFELMIFLTTVWNALDRPRSHDFEMATIMYRDGSMYFFGLFALRLVNMVISLVAPSALVFLAVFLIWSVSNITLAHLILNLRRLPRGAAKGGLEEDEEGEEEEEEEEGTQCGDEHDVEKAQAPNAPGDEGNTDTDPKRAHRTLSASHRNVSGRPR